jgi:hypothetical protein
VSGAPTTPAELRGKNDWPKHTAGRAAAAPQTGEVGNIDKPHAEINHVITPSPKGRRRRTVDDRAALNGILWEQLHLAMLRRLREAAFR